MTAFIKADDVDFSYQQEEGDVQALRSLSLRVEPGEKVVILGQNGSGKSTLARLFIGLALPDKGRILTGGIDTADDEQLFELRRRCGLIFQNPDNQIVGTTVEEDVAFGPENIGVPLPELRERVELALQTVGLYDRRKEAPANLSGGQKQKLAIAGILAMEPDGIILDEATAMLDPVSRFQLLSLLQQLIHDRGLTAVQITHHIDEALDADRLFVMEQGELVLAGTPETVLADPDRLRALGLEAPFHLDFCKRLAQLADRPLPASCVDRDGALAFALDCVNALAASGVAASGVAAPGTAASGVAASGVAASGVAASGTVASSDPAQSAASAAAAAEIVISVEHLSYFYDGPGQGAPALKDVTFAVRRGECFGIMGQTGSGKSTLVQHLNALIRPQTGSVQVLEYDTADKKRVKALRRRIGLLFQYPEHQLFAETCYQDIAFGPRQLGLPEAELDDRIKGAAAVVGLAENLLDRSPFALSGGQKRRVALAGVLALRPEILVLDEPAAGLDPQSKAEIFHYIQKLKEEGVTILLVSHDMTELARLADRILLLDAGQVRAVGTPRELFSQADLLTSCRLEVPAPVAFLRNIAVHYPAVDPFCLTPDRAADNLWRAAVEKGVAK